VKNYLDSPETTIARREIIQKNSFLKAVYANFYNTMADLSVGLPHGIKIEIGSGGGFAKKILKGVKTSDVLKLPFCDMHFPAEKIPLKDNSVSAFYMLNTFHHIKNPQMALQEMKRCLKTGGKIIMIEPATTPFSRFIYSNFHHEVFCETAEWKTRQVGPLSDSNQALAWIIFNRDKNKFVKTFPELSIMMYQNHTPFSYLLSGGFKYPQLLPGSLYPLIKKIEKTIAFLNNTLGLFVTIVLIKGKSIPKK